MLSGMFHEVNGKYVQMTDAEVKAYWAAAEAEAQARIAAKGHDCNDYVQHSTFRTSRGGMQDAYNCGRCGDLLQVG